MVTVHREQGLRFVIFLQDHEPAHVHVIGDGNAKIDLAGADGEPALIWAYDFSKADLRKAMRIVAEQQGVLLARWRELHG